MILLAKFRFSACFFILVLGVEDSVTYRPLTRAPSRRAARDCSLVHCLADKEAIGDAANLESLSVYNYSHPKSKSVLATVSATRPHLSDNGQNKQVRLSGNFSSRVANIWVSISDGSTCQSSVLTCEVKYVGKTGGNLVGESVLHLGQNSRLNSSKLLLTKTYVEDAMHELADRLAQRLDKVESENTRRNCQPNSNSPPREVMTMEDGTKALCDTQSNGGNWIVFQRRVKRINFDRVWAEYKNGFGDVKADGEFWLGNEKIHQMTSQDSYELRLDFTLKNKSTFYARYRNFRISGESDNYRLSVGNATGGNVGNFTQLYNHNNMKFSTRDRDNDKHHLLHCAKLYRAGWWYKGCRLIDFNSPWWTYVYLDQPTNPIVFTEMKMRVMRPPK